MYMFMIFNVCIYNVCKLLYHSTVHRLYIHGIDMSVHVYARWSGFQMYLSCSWSALNKKFVFVSMNKITPGPEWYLE
jgi:hypothetical protein